MNNFAEKLKIILLEKDITPYRLSQLSGIRQSTLSAILNGINTPSGRTIQKICNALGVSMAEFDENKKEVTEMLPLIMNELENMEMNEEEKAAYELIKKTPIADLEKDLRDVLTIAKKIKNLSVKNQEAIKTIVDSLASTEK